MSKTLLDHFERAIRQRNMDLAGSLQPGLPEDRIRRMLQAADVKGDVEPVVSVYSWKNGSQADPRASLAEVSVFPDLIYVFADLKTMIAHFSEFHEGFVYHPKFHKVDGRYSPLFWDNSTAYLAVDLHNTKHRIVLLEPETEELAQEAYGSFEEFLKDAIRANEEKDTLICFQP